MTKQRIAIYITTMLALLVWTVSGCKHEPQPVPEEQLADGGFPDDVARIFVNRCVVCHNEANASGSGGLRLDSWAELFKGGNSGASVIALSTAHSSLLYFINTDSTLGPVSLPRMPESTTPYPAPPLTREEYLIISDWIARGAPDRDGNLPYGSNPDTRQKIYIAQQGCDLVAVVDAESGVVMRYIPVGKSPAIEGPHCVRVSEDGRYAYVSFIGGQYVQKINTSTDQVEGEVNVGVGSWNVFQLSPDGNKMLISNWEATGKMVLINTQNMTITATYAGLNLFSFPHGIASTPSFDTFYITSQYGNCIYKLIPGSAIYDKISLNGQAITHTSVTNVTPDPHEILPTPDHRYYFITCENTRQVKVMDGQTNLIVKTFDVGEKPQEIAVSKTKPYMFVTCMEDNSSQPGSLGSVYVFNYETLTQVQRIDGNFYQPHGIAVDDRNGRFYIASRNASATGPAPHHTSACAGRNGWYSIYDLNTLQPFTNKRFEITVDPYSADVRFK